ncbi:glycosyltransferase [Actinomycetospora sp. OC33-EN08]|uniref:Glycosyltransferase n=1 Tax=Actinomycetospora aurantiaca TaxID=3129233 RepID=A0ABU8MGH9_9PSEU
MTVDPLPSVSVAITNYNYGPFLGECLDSVLDQTITAEQVVVVDDGSTDTSRNVLQAYEKSITVIYTENRGVGAATARVIDECISDIILLLDSDDLMHHLRIEEVARIYATHRDVQWVYHDVEYVDQDSQLVPPPNDTRVSLVSGPQDHRAAARRGKLPTKFPPTAGLSWRRDFLQARLPLPLPLSSQDNYLKFVSAGLGRGYYLETKLAYQRIHAKNAYTGVKDGARETFLTRALGEMTDGLDREGLHRLSARFRARVLLRGGREGRRVVKQELLRLGATARVLRLLTCLPREAASMVRESCLRKRRARRSEREGPARLMVVCNDLHPYGAQRVSTVIAAGLTRYADVSLTTLERRSQTELTIPPKIENSRSLDRTFKGSIGYFELILKMGLTLVKNRPDVLLSNMLFSNLVCIPIAKALRIPVCVVEHNVPENLSIERSERVLLRLAKTLYHHADAFVGVSKEVTSRSEKAFALDLTRCFTIYNALPISEIKLRSEKVIEHPWFSGVDSQHVVTAVCVGAFRHAKGQDLLLHAMSALPELRVAFLGTGPLLDNAILLARQLGVQDRCVFLGHIENPYPYMSKSRLVIVPSRWEGFGLVAAEAGLLGTPVVATDVPGLRELVPRYVGGVLAQRAAAEPLREAISIALQSQRLESDLSEFSPESSAARYWEVLSARMTKVGPR